MSRFVTEEAGEKVLSLMFGEFKGTPLERFLQEELVRYVPQLVGRTDREVNDFIRYQRMVYLDGVMPQIGRPVASLNPMFHDSIGSLVMSLPGRRIYTRASTKVNGYRMQIHRASGSCAGFSRQFTSYDLRMFPELAETLKKLPLMIGDAELVNKRHKHLAGFNRVEIRIPGATHWPQKGEKKLPDEFIEKYLANPDLFEAGVPHKDLEMTLVFHGLFAIADPKTWGQSRKIQEENMISLCQLPIDYERIDALLTELGHFLAVNDLNAGIVERYVATTPNDIAAFIADKDEEGQEGVCIVQSVMDNSERLLPAPHAIKVKKYETMDMSVLGLYVGKDTEAGVGGITGALLGLYDKARGMYLPAAKVNLDPAGRQIKTEGQRKRLIGLRDEISKLASQNVRDPVSMPSVPTLFEVFLLEGERVLHYLLKDYHEKPWTFKEILGNIPRTYDLVKLYDLFKENEEAFRARKMKQSTVAKAFVHAKLEFFEAVSRLDERGKRRFREYFGEASKIRTLSNKLVKPDFILDVGQPIIVEAHIFDIKFGSSPFAAGFHSWFRNSFCFSNNYAERVRHDKNTTTDYETVYVLARMNTPRKPRQAEKV